MIKVCEKTLHDFGNQKTKRAPSERHNVTLNMKRRRNRFKLRIISNYCNSVARCAVGFIPSLKGQIIEICYNYIRIIWNKGENFAITEFPPSPLPSRKFAEKSQIIVHSLSEIAILTQRDDIMLEHYCDSSFVKLGILGPQFVKMLIEYLKNKEKNKEKPNKC